jgi:hypothetical protein
VSISTSPPPVWAWPLAILLGFPIGGLIADLIVGPVDSFGAALAGGLIAGAVIGVAQWLALRQFIPWDLDCSDEYRDGRGPHHRLGARRLRDQPRRPHAHGCTDGRGCRGVARQHISGAAWWAAANPPAWALAWLVSSYVLSSNVDEQFTNFGASGALLYALLTGLLLGALFRRAESQSGTEPASSVTRPEEST